MIFIRSFSIFTGSVSLVRSRRCEMRWTCVSTTTPDAIPNAVPSTTLAVLRAAPGTVSSWSMSRGISPPKSLRIFLRRADHRLGLVVEEAGGPDVLRQFVLAGGGEILNGRVFLEQAGRHHVHALVGALRGEDGGDQQLPGVRMMQRAGDVGVHLVQRREDFFDAGGALGGGLRFCDRFRQAT